MTYKKTFYFICKCLSLAKYPERKHEVSKIISTENIDWDNVVRISSDQMVVPSLYYNLKQAQLLNLLPEGLEYYFEEISNKNKQRNELLIKQVNHLVKVLDEHQIKPVFLKGIANILEGMYIDVGERMLSDIDFLVAKDQIEEVVSILKENGYTRLSEKSNHTKRHYSRLIHEDFIGAVEIHWEVVNPKNTVKLSGELLYSNKQKKDQYYFPSYGHQAIYNMLNAQINENSYKNGVILLRHLYDCFLLIDKAEVQSAFKNFSHHYYLKNLYLKCLHKFFNTEEKLYNRSFILNILMLRYEISTNVTLFKIEKIIIYYSFRLFNYPYRIILMIINKKIRQEMIKNLTTKGWLKRHMNSYKK